jgi:glycine/D-amino acid oxidase-like deaminating enzyme
LQKLPFINEILKPIFKTHTFAKQIDRFGFNGIHEYSIFNPFEGQIDTGNMMQNLLKLAISKNILILNNQTVSSFNDTKFNVDVALNNFSFKTQKLLFATNGFASELTNGQVQPARAQVLITEPIPNLDIKGTFHIDKGYCYFRNIDNRILIGGARNLDFETENTSDFGLTKTIQNRLEELLKDVILPNKEFKIETRWSGIMGLGNSKIPIISKVSENVFCGVRLGGMGVAIGSLVGTELADLI